MRIVWTDEALDDLADILAYYHLKVGAATAAAVEWRILEQIEGLQHFPERIRTSEPVPGARELVIDKLPYIAFIRLQADRIIVLNVLHTARKFPA